MRKRFRHAYKYPTRDIAGGVQVGIIAMSADLTPKLGLCFSIRFGNMPTFKTSPARIAWINCFYRKSSSLSFVLDKSAKLAKPPVMQSLPLLFIGLNPASDMRQVFERNTHAVAFSSGNDSFRDAVVLVFLESLLLTAYFAKATFCGTRANTLQLCTPLGISRPVGFDSSAGILVAKTVGCDVHDAHVNTKHSIRGEQTRVIEIAYGADVPLAAHEHKINFALAMLQQSSLMLATSERYFVSAGKEPDRNHVFIDKPEYTVIVWLRGVLAKYTNLLLVKLVRISNFSDTAHGYLGGQTESIPKFSVKRLVHVVLAKYTLFKSKLGKPIACLVTTLKRTPQSGFLLFRWNQFEVGNKLHVSSIEHNKIAFNIGEREKGAACAAALSLTGMNAGVSRAI